LGLVGYYRHFIKNFGILAAPLTNLLRKNNFQWSDQATESFVALKSALSSAPVLHLPDFAKLFIVDCDASGTGFGAVLHQGEGPLAFYSKPFAPRHLKLAAYERELIGLVQAVRHWRPYLWGRRFLVRTDHYALKFMLDQKLSTVPQHQWVSKLFGFADVRDRLLQAQQYAKRHYDTTHRALEFAVHDWVWLRLLNRNTHSLLHGAKSKLSPRYAGPFQVIEKIGDVAYRLRLPAGARIHDVFHVGVLKPFHGNPPVSTPPLPPLQDGRLLQQPAKILKSQLRRGVWHVLVHWSGLPEADATWEPVPNFKETYPEFQLEDELFLEGGRDVMTGKVYVRRSTATD